MLPRHTWFRNDGTNRETSKGRADLRKQLGKKNRGNEENGVYKNGRSESGGWSERKY